MSDDDDNLVVLPPRPEGDGGARSVPEELLVPALEACLFAVTGARGASELARALGVEQDVVQRGLEVLRERLVRTGSGLRLVEVGAGWQLRTDPRLAAWVAAARGGKAARLSRPAMETLSIVAYRQPVPKADVDDLRGVDSGGVLRMLAERGLIRVVGRSEEPGRPATWGTTAAFLELFGLKSLADLPTLRDLRAVDADAGGEGEVVPFPGPPDRGDRG